MAVAPPRVGPSGMSAPSSARYRTEDIQVLEGLEPVRKRPAMYIGGVDAKGLHHLAWEILDNAVDEYINGYADHITVVLHKAGDAVTVTDNGRGIPIDVHPKYKQNYARGTPTTKLEKVGPFRGHGTGIYFEPDDTIFKTTRFDADVIKAR